MRRSPRPVATTARRECADLRARAENLREHSRNLKARSRDVLERMSRAHESIEDAKVALAARPGAATPRIDHLLRVEADLEAAIAECRVALEEVRRELGWRDDGPLPLVVH